MTPAFGGRYSIQLSYGRKGISMNASLACVKGVQRRDICAVAVFGSPDSAAVIVLAGTQRARENEQVEQMRIIVISMK